MSNIKLCLTFLGKRYKLLHHILVFTKSGVYFRRVLLQLYDSSLFLFCMIPIKISKSKNCTLYKGTMKVIFPQLESVILTQLLSIM